ncbi:single-stranded-DNA-specific exonuclease RecJ [Acidithiobacillus sp. CV18-2]|nr:single-stranded-DNA-specific exonuclease RecJ [Acidithiobacillus sp. CV18-3]MBU2757886.1 single-stranded-DNA-specific exonuclease RecJ [Acidithiobacillus sp. BN09-2]MBU2778194.1 single-stranded-DNA-specific exonuclease RecJ [Acidithiobacillus sp. CV18-2]MBU2800547.1 single-stranded-DNA-specific exonuclease RecJ [Acidithiobacillus sp. VAN18-4]
MQVRTEPDLIRRLLLARGADPDDTLDLNTLYPPLGPQGMLGMREAVEGILHAIREQWPTVIVGDYDVDGACASAILLHGLDHVLPVRSIVPDRLKEGYGLTESVADRIPADTKLVITVDNGISAHAGISKLKDRGIRVIVTDHHLAGPTRPPADIIVNPNQPGCPFPAKSTCGAGVAWYLLWALHAIAGDRAVSTSTLESLLDLVAMATVADMVPLDRNNRVLVANGLRRIRQGLVNPGLSGLMVHAGVDYRHITEQDFGFKLGPRLNAAGRLAHIQTGIWLLLSRDAQNIDQWSQFLDTMNAQRKSIQSDIERDALEIVNSLSMSDDPVICVGSDRWHSGVVGIVASKLKERYQRPAFVFASTGEMEQTAQGSGRSMPGWHLRDALALVDARHPGLISRFGGHAMAAGLSFPKEYFDAFRQAINQVALEQNPLQATSPLHGTGHGNRFAEQVWCDGPLRAEELNLEMARSIQMAGPWGQGFPEPLFENDFVVMGSRKLNGGHWKLELALAGNIVGNERVEAVHFLDGRETGEIPEVGTRIRGRYQMGINRWKGRETLQIQLRQVMASPAPEIGKQPVSPVWRNPAAW